MECLVQEIGKYMSSITEIALEEENSHKYFSMMQRSEELYR